MSEFDERAYIRGFEQMITMFDTAYRPLERAGKRGNAA
jgi:hypothetical protein